MSDQPHTRELVVNPSTRVVHRADCFQVSIMQLAEPLPLEQWPEDARDQLRGCGNCMPSTWRPRASRRPKA